MTKKIWVILLTVIIAISGIGCGSGSKEDKAKKYLSQMQPLITEFAETVKASKNTIDTATYDGRPIEQFLDDVKNKHASELKKTVAKMNAINPDKDLSEIHSLLLTGFRKNAESYEYLIESIQKSDYASKAKSDKLAADANTLITQSFDKLAEYAGKPIDELLKK